MRDHNACPLCGAHLMVAWPGPKDIGNEESCDYEVRCHRCEEEVIIAFRWVEIPHIDKAALTCEIIPPLYDEEPILVDLRDASPLTKGIITNALGHIIGNALSRILFPEKPT